LITIVKPDAEGSDVLPTLEADVAAKLTIGGELNKIASNVAMGRSMGGVHWVAFTGALTIPAACAWVRLLLR
jgi:hypothetical protein